jgi:DUF1365 family protein
VRPRGWSLAEASALYVGNVSHVRLGPVRHRFSQQVHMLYLDTDELSEPRSTGPLLSSRRWRPLQLRSSDYGASSWPELAAQARKLARQATGVGDLGPVRLLVHPRVWGWSFTPLALAFCFDPPGQRVLSVIGTVTNTPWGQRHSYPLAARPDGTVDTIVQKALHVSPFFPIKQSYRFRFTQPGPTFRASVDVFEGDAPVLRATLHLQRRPLNRLNLARALLLHPASSWSVSTGIYWQAAKLALKGAPFYAHPAKHTGDGALAHACSRCDAGTFFGGLGNCASPSSDNLGGTR